MLGFLHVGQRFREFPLALRARELRLYDVGSRGLAPLLQLARDVFETARLVQAPPGNYDLVLTATSAHSTLEKDVLRAATTRTGAPTDTSAQAAPRSPEEITNQTARRTAMQR